MKETKLSPELVAEGWRAIGGPDWIIWMHPSSKRVVTVEGPYKWGHTSGIPAHGDAPASFDVEGWVVACTYRDTHGNPVRGDSLFVRDHAMAVRIGRRIRADILAERPVVLGEQLTLGGTS